jgi:2-succinyl-6-hydroxy-2,4-cyclohexadiene-1-carboxylate synthase
LGGTPKTGHLHFLEGLALSTPQRWHEFTPAPADAPAVLLLHGFMGCGADWKFAAHSLCPGYRCLCPDLPGHGAAASESENAGANMEETAAMLLRGLEEHGVGTCALAGYSMGGRVALYLAVQYPERFTCLMLESASPGIADPEARLERRRQDEERALKLSRISQDGPDFREFLRAWYEQPLFGALRNRPALLEERIARRLHTNPRALAASLRGLGTGLQPSLWEQLSSVKIPVLLITGGEDSKFCAIAASMAALLPRVRHEVIQDCGHCAHEEDPERFAEIFRRFLQETDT